MSPNDPNAQPYQNFQTERFGHPDKPNPENSPTQPPKSSGGKCLLWGCLIATVMSVLLVVGGGFGIYWFLTQQVEKYTELEPANIPVVEASQEELDAIQQRIDAFSDTVKADLNKDEAPEAIPPSDVPATAEVTGDDAMIEASGDEIPTAPTPTELVLTADELNALIAANPDLRGRLFVSIADGVLSGKISMPMDFVPGGQGRFLNADGELDASMENGVLVVRLIKANIKGEPLPPEFMEGMSQQNLAKDAYKDAENARVLRQFESIEVVDDKIVLRLRQD